MNSEQILLLVAALGVVTFAVLTTVGAKKKPGTTSPIGHPRGAGTSPPNRAQRRKRR